MSEIVNLYNPANASALTPDQVNGLQKLSSAEIKELAQAYPNAVLQKAYLLIVDSTKPIEKQLPALSSFENLYNLRERNGQKNWVAFAFRGNYKPQRITPVRVRKSEVLDLSDVELKELPGFKTANEVIPPETVMVKKVKKAKATEEDTTNTN